MLGRLGPDYIVTALMMNLCLCCRNQRHLWPNNAYSDVVVVTLQHVRRPDKTNIGNMEIFVFA